MEVTRGGGINWQPPDNEPPKKEEIVVETPQEQTTKTAPLAVAARIPSAADSINPGWKYDPGSKRSGDVEQSMVGGRGGVIFITGNTGAELVVKTQFHPVSATFSSFFHQQLGVAVPVVKYADDPQEVAHLQELTGQQVQDFLLMSRVSGIALSQVHYSIEKNNFDPPLDFKELGRIAFIDAFIMNQADRISITPSDVLINSDNIMMDPNRKKLYVIDNDSNLHQEPSRFRSSVSMMFEESNQVRLLDKFIDYGLQKPSGTRKAILDNNINDFRKGIQNGIVEIKSSFVAQNKAYPDLVVKFVDNYYNMHPNVDSSARGNLVTNITSQANQIIEGTKK